MSRVLLARMRESAARLVASFDDDARAAGLSPFGSPDRRVWTYLPGPRPGVRLGDLDAQQRALVRDLVATALSDSGARTADEVMELDGVLRDLEREEARSGGTLVTTGSGCSATPPTTSGRGTSQVTTSRST